jgi:hypothetical protein
MQGVRQGLFGGMEKRNAAFLDKGNPATQDVKGQASALTSASEQRFD